MTICVTCVKRPGGNTRYKKVNKYWSASLRYILLLFALFICVRKAIKTGELCTIDKIKWPRIFIVLSSPQSSALGLDWTIKILGHLIFSIIPSYPVLIPIQWVLPNEIDEHSQPDQWKETRHQFANYTEPYINWKKILLYNCIFLYKKNIWDLHF